MDPEAPGLPEPRPPATVLEEACAHLDTAAQQLTATAEDVFSPTIALAGQINLLRATIGPGIRAVADPDDPWDALRHLDHALALLETLPPGQAPTGLEVCAARLARLRPAVHAATRADGGRAPADRPWR